MSCFYWYSNWEIIGDGAAFMYVVGVDNLRALSTIHRDSREMVVGLLSDSTELRDVGP
jgi:hypothetical protein